MNEDEFNPIWILPTWIIIGLHWWLLGKDLDLSGMSVNDSTILMAQKFAIAFVLGIVTIIPIIMIFERIGRRMKNKRISKNIEREVFIYQEYSNKEENKVEDIIFLKKKDGTSYSLEICESWIGERNSIIIEKLSYKYRSEKEKKSCPCCEEEMGFDRDGRLKSSCACPSIKRLVKA